MKHNIMLEMLSTVEKVYQNLDIQVVLKLISMSMLDILLFMAVVVLILLFMAVVVLSKEFQCKLQSFHAYFLIFC